MKGGGEGEKKSDVEKEKKRGSSFICLKNQEELLHPCNCS